MASTILLYVAYVASTYTKEIGMNALKRLVTPSPDLAVIVGTDPLTRADVTKRVWDYIKARELQDTLNKRMINADDALRPVFYGKPQVSMFEMTALVNTHLTAVKTGE